RIMFRRLASCHAIPFLVNAYSALLSIPREGTFDCNSLTLRWIVSEIMGASQHIDAANLKPIVNLGDRPRVGTDQTYSNKTRVLTGLSPTFVEMIKSAITP